MQGAKQLLWNLVDAKITKFWEYVYFIEDKYALESTTLLICEIVNETLQKKLVNKAHNAINFLNQTSNSTLATLGVKDRFVIIIWDKRFLEKYNLMNNVQAKAKQMEKEVKHFKETFKKLFEKGLPSFWDNTNKLISKDDYDTLLSQVRLDHSKFENMEKGLKGEVIVNNLTDDFDVLGQFQVIKSNLPPIYFTSCVE